MKNLLQRGLAVLGSVAMLAAPLASQAAVTTSFSAGDLIKGESWSSVYYFAENGKRYTFPNEKTYFSWYANFDTVKTIPDTSLQALPLGGNVTYRPGYKMVKVDTDPRTYVVDQGGVLRHVPSEQLAETLYGMNWNNRIDDIADAFFVNYQIGTPLAIAADYSPADVMTLTPNISQDKNLANALVTVTIGSVESGFVPKTITVKTGSEVTWVNRDNKVHSVASDAFNSPVLQPNEQYTRRFTTVGSFNYSDGSYPAMQATINVVN